MYALFFFPAAVIFLRGDTAPYHHIYSSLCLFVKLQWEALFFFFFLLSESDIAELPLLLAEAFCSLAGKYSGCELFSFCVPKYELAFVIYYSLQYLNSDYIFLVVVFCFRVREGMFEGVLFVLLVFLLVFQSASLLWLKSKHNGAFPLCGQFISWVKDFMCGRLMYFVHFSVSAACSFPFSSSSSCCSASGQRWLCWQRVHCSPGSWGALYRKSAEPQCVPKSTLWTTWRSEGTDLGTVLQKGAIFVFWQHLYVLKNIF